MLEPEEKDRVFRDLYGTEEALEETPDFVQQKLEELDGELSMLHEHVIKYYTRAMTIERQKVDGASN